MNISIPPSWQPISRCGIWTDASRMVFWIRASLVLPYSINKGKNLLLWRKTKHPYTSLSAQVKDVFLVWGFFLTYQMTSLYFFFNISSVSNVSKLCIPFWNGISVSSYMSGQCALPPESPLVAECWPLTVPTKSQKHLGNKAAGKATSHLLKRGMRRLQKATCIYISAGRRKWIDTYFQARFLLWNSQELSCCVWEI